MNPIPPPPPNRGGSYVQSVQRASRLLGCFAEAGGHPLTLTELARRTGLTTSTAHRLLRTLCAEGVLVQNHDTERYSLGPQLRRLAQAAFDASGLADVRHELDALVEATGEAASLGVREETDVLVVVRSEAPHALRFDRPPGSRVHLHCSAMGKALLAFGRDSIADSVRDAGPLLALTPRTITSPRRLERDLRETRDRGYAIVDEEQFVGVRSVGAPIVGHDGAATAAVAVQGPVARIPDDRISEVGAAVRATAAHLAGMVSISALFADHAPRVSET